jgi:hypothetical protein
MGNHQDEGNFSRKKKSDKMKITRQKMGPYSTRDSRIKEENLISKNSLTKLPNSIS